MEQGDVTEKDKDTKWGLGTCDMNRWEADWEVRCRKKAFHCFWISRVLLLRFLFNRVPFRPALSEVKCYLLKILSAFFGRLHLLNCTQRNCAHFILLSVLPKQLRLSHNIGQFFCPVFLSINPGVVAATSEK